MSTAEAKKRAPLILASLLVLQVLIISLQPRPGRDEQSLWRTAVMTVFAPVQSVTSWAGGGVSHIWHNYADLRGAREESEQLRAELGQLREAALKSQEMAAEAERLRKILDLQPSLPYKSVVGRVISRNTSLWLDRITINRGTLQGVQKHYPVITPDGVVGHVVAVAPNAAQVQLITDARAGVGVRLRTTRALGEIRGVNSAFPEVRNVSNLEAVEPGEEVLTSGLDGIYPQGLLIGKVRTAEKRSDDVTQRISVAPAARLGALEEVIVLQVDPAALREQVEAEFQNPPVETKAVKKPVAAGEKSPPKAEAGKTNAKKNQTSPTGPAPSNPR